VDVDRGPDNTGLTLTLDAGRPEAALASHRRRRHFTRLARRWERVRTANSSSTEPCRPE
jgi:hypothetical protein